MMRSENVGSEMRFRNDIQGLRAVAVMAVVVYHIWPSMLPGGFVGVDVFFVISGYLITLNLLREVEDKGWIDLLAFYIRRALRLMPAAAFVIFASLLLMPLHSSVYQWTSVVWQAFASLFYFQNWLLFHEAVDYLSIDSRPTAFQHFWSLAIEEQFYLFWPVVLISSLPIARLLGASYRKILLVACALVVLGSFICSLTLSGPEAPEAYFATHVRLWELALGGLLAISGMSIGPRWKDAAMISGLLLILMSTLLFSGNIVFPGYLALVPTIGAALILAPGNTQSSVVANLLSNRVCVFLGGISYSLYLVHWPLIVFLKPKDEPFTIVYGLLVAAAAILIGWAMKRWIEDAFRASGRLSLRSLRPVLVSSLFCLVPMAAYTSIAISGNSGPYNAARYPGAMVLADGSAKIDAQDTDYYPSLETVKHDRAILYDNGCHLGFNGVSPKDCRFGKADGELKVFLIGDSHAVNWYPALEMLAEEHGWSGYTFTKSSCPLVQVTLQRSNSPYTACLEWGKLVLERIKRDKPDLVIFGQMASTKLYPSTDEVRSMPQVLADLWRQIRPHVGKIVVMADTARWRSDPNECVAEGANCNLPSAKLLPEDPLVKAAALSPDEILVDMNGFICPNGMCSPVVGNVLVWRDQHHLTATYSRSLRLFLFEQLKDVVSLPHS